MVLLPPGEAAVAAQWQWITPGVATLPACPTGTWYTDTRFSVSTSTRFADVLSSTPYGEEVRLFQHFWSAELDLDWDNDCPSHNQSSPPCLMYPVAALPDEALLGARSKSVLLIRDVNQFNRCQDATAKCGGSGDYTLAKLKLFQDKAPARNIFEAGQEYTATWWLRSPGIGPNPPTGPGEFNDRMCGFTISFSYTSVGSWTTDFMGGVTEGCTEKNVTIGCLDRKRSCPIRLRTADPPEAGSATLYLNNPLDPGHAPYTPFSFSFRPGSLQGVGAQWQAKSCAQDDTNGQAEPLCAQGKGVPEATPQGVWEFLIHTKGSGDTDTKSQCGTTPPQSLCQNSRASASMYLDGLMITAGHGTYTSPVFDSLSPFTKWSTFYWDADLSPAGAGGPARTPLALQLRIANACANLDETVPFTVGAVTLLVESGWSTLYGSPLSTTTFQFGGTGRYFQYRALFTSWSENLAVAPPATATYFAGYSSCVRFDPRYDGSLTPKLRQLATMYLPDAGRFVSAPICPPKLRGWKTLEYAVSGPPGSVTADIVDEDNVPIPGYTGLSSGAGLDGRDGKPPIDAARHPRLRVQFTLFKQNGTADPRVSWFRLSWDPMPGCLALDHNAVRLSRGEATAIRFCTKETGTVEVRIYDAAGQLVKRLFKGDLKAGEVCQKAWNGTSDLGDPPASCSPDDANPQGVRVAPGVYFVAVTTPAGRETARLAVVR